MKHIAFILAITMASFLVIASLPSRGQGQKVSPWKGKRADGTIITKEELSRILKDHKRWLKTNKKRGQRAQLSGTDLREATLIKADLSWVDLRGADLSKAKLWRADLREAKLTETDLRGASLNGADLRWAVLNGVTLTKASVQFTDFGKSWFEPQTIEGFVFLGAKGLSTIRFKNFKVIADLRKTAKESGLRNEERALTAALRKYRLRAARLHERIFEYILFDLPTDPGANPWRSIGMLVLLIPVFSILYMIALVKPGEDGIWKVWIPGRVRKDLGEEKPVRLTLSVLAAFRTGFYFIVLSAFSIGWRELNVGNWIARMQRRECTLRASGWTRTISGIQSLISVYLLALWLLTYFGRPFE